MKYAKINLFDIANGEGIRVSLFVTGCKFHCKGCFNQDAQDFSYGKDFTSESAELILNRLKDERFDGLTLIGGDPLWQTTKDIKTLTKLCKEVHKLNKNVWIWSGFTWEDIFSGNEEEQKARQELISNCDVFIDGLFEEDKKDLSLAWRGSSNQRIINVKESLKENSVITM